MHRLPHCVSATAFLVIAALTPHQVNAQPIQPPMQDCEQAAGIQSSAQDQDQSCNTVFKDPDLSNAPITEIIQRMVDSSPSLGDGPYVLVNPESHLDYVFVSTSVSNAGDTVVFDGTAIAGQLGFDPGVTITFDYDVTNVTEGQQITLTDETIGNQIFGACPEGVALIKNGGKNQTVTVIADPDMWRYTVPTDPTSEVVCGVRFTTPDPINVLVAFYLAGPSGLFATQNITNACAFFNEVPGSQHTPVSNIRGGSLPTADGIPAGINLTGCSGFTASYCDFGEDAGLFNSCNPNDLPLLGGAEAQPSVTVGAPFTPPGNGPAALTLNSGSDSTSTSFGGLSGGSLISGSPP